MKEIINLISEKLAEEFEIEYFFTSYKVEVLIPEVKQEVTHKEFTQAYTQRLIKLSTERHTREKNNYNDSLYFWRRFYLLNTLTLLKFMGVNVDKEKKFKSNKVDAFALDIMIHKFDTDTKRDKVRHTFGSVEVIEESLPF